MNSAPKEDLVLSSAISQEDLQALAAMGFPENYVHIAYKKSKDKEMQAVMDWLLENQSRIETLIEKKRNKLLLKQQNASSPSKEDNKDEPSQHRQSEDTSENLENSESASSSLSLQVTQPVNKNSVEAPNKPSMNPNQTDVAQITQGKAISSQNLNAEKHKFNYSDAEENSSSDEESYREHELNKSGDNDETDEAIMLKNMSYLALNRFKYLSVDLVEFESPRPLDICKFLYDFVNKLKHSKETEDKEIIACLSNLEITRGQVGFVRKKLLHLFRSVFKTKFKRSSRSLVLDLVADMSMLETTFLNIIQLGFFNKEQYQKLKLDYVNFCKKLKIRQNKDIMSFVPISDKRRIQNNTAEKGQKQEDEREESKLIEEDGRDEENKVEDGSKQSEKKAPKQLNKAFLHLMS